MNFGLILLSLVLSTLGQDSKLVYKLITENNHILVQHATAIWTHIRPVRNWAQFQKVAKLSNTIGIDLSNLNSINCLV